MGAMSDTTFAGWPATALEWFDELEANNERAWFQAHKKVYDHDVRGPMVALLEELADEFGEFRLSRPNRDTRFSHDKSPYKPEIYARTVGPAGGLYVQLRSEGLFAGGGLYAPDRDTLARLRAAIADDRSGPELVRIVAELEASGAELVRDGALRTAPRGYPVDHPRIDLLRLPHLAGGWTHPAGPWLHTPAAKDRVVADWRTVGPLLDWAAAHLGT